MGTSVLRNSKVRNYKVKNSSVVVDSMISGGSVEGSSIIKSTITDSIITRSDLTYSLAVRSYVEVSNCFNTSICNSTVKCSQSTSIHCHGTSISGKSNVYGCSIIECDIIRTDVDYQTLIGMRIEDDKVTGEKISISSKGNLELNSTPV